MMLEMKTILKSIAVVLLGWFTIGNSNAQTYQIQIDSVAGIPDTIANGETVSFFMQVSLSSPLAFQGNIFLELEYGGMLYEVDSTLVNENFLSPSTPNTIQATHRFSTDDDLSIGDNVVVVWPRIGNGATPPQVVVNPYEITISIIEPNSISDDGNNQIKPLKCFPNPADDFLQIPSNPNNPFVSLRLTNLAGQVMISESVSSNSIDVSGIPKGLYFLETIASDGSRYAAKLVVAHQ